MGIPSDIVKELRKDKNLTQSDVARYFGISAPLYCMYETGTRKMSLDMLCALAAYWTHLRITYLVEPMILVHISGDVDSIFKTNEESFLLRLLL